MIRCPKCNHEFKNPHAVKGGSRRVAKGFSSPSVQAKAQAALKTKRALDSAMKNKAFFLVRAMMKILDATCGIGVGWGMKSWKTYKAILTLNQF